MATVSAGPSGRARTSCHPAFSGQKTARALGIGVRTLGLKIKKWKEEQLVAPTL